MHQNLVSHFDSRLPEVCVIQFSDGSSDQIDYRIDDNDGAVTSKILSTDFCPFFRADFFNLT